MLGVHPVRPALQPAAAVASCGDEDVIVEAREVAAALVADDPDLSGHPDLARAVRRLHEAEQADYLEKA